MRCARPRLQCLPRRFDRHYVLAGLRLPNSRVVASRLWRDFPKMAPRLSEPYRRAQFLLRLDRSCGSQISVCFGRKWRERRPFPRRRSEEHTSELQSQFHLVCRLLLEKKKKKKIQIFSIKKKNTNTK